MFSGETFQMHFLPYAVCVYILQTGQDANQVDVPCSDVHGTACWYSTSTENRVGGGCELHAKTNVRRRVQHIFATVLIKKCSSKMDRFSYFAFLTQMLFIPAIQHASCVHARPL